ncbi:unnamed protein product, partial [Symbiodinium necroappetens]
LCKPPCLRNSLHPVLSGPQDTLPRLVPDAPDHRLNVRTGSHDTPACTCARQPADPPGQ